MNERPIGTESLSLQDILSFGYLYLMILGITSDSIYYGLLGVNIISYSNVLDVLLSPIVHLTSNIQFPMVIIVFPIISFFFLRYLENKQRRSNKSVEKSKKSIPLRQLWIMLSAVVIFSAFFGYGLGGGVALKKRMANGTIKANHSLEFGDQSKIKVRLLGNTSSYLLYIKEGGNVVTITPISDNITAIEKLK